VFGHAGPVYMNFVVSPPPLPIWRDPTVALLNGACARAADFVVTLLCITWRCQCGRGKRYSKHSQTLLEHNHEVLLPLWPGVPNALHRTGHLLLVGKPRLIHVDATGWLLRNNLRVRSTPLAARLMRVACRGYRSAESGKIAQI